MGRPVKIAAALAVVTAFVGVGIGVASSCGCTVSAPEISVPPAIAGTTTAGQMLTASSGSWRNAPTSFSYQWENCDSLGANCFDIEGATASRYPLAKGDVGNTLRVKVIATNAKGSAPARSLQTAMVASGAVFPLSVSANGRYLRTAAGSPFLMVGDSPWSVTANLSEANAARYLADRKKHGFNTIMFALICDGYTGCNANGTTYDNIKPFTTGTNPGNYDLSTPNSAFFSSAHDLIAQAQADGLEVMVDPIETGGCTIQPDKATAGWMTALQNNGDGSTSTSTKDYQYGQYLGNTFKDLKNIIWMSGNDFQCYTTTADNNDALAVAEGIQNTEPTALQTLELNYNSSDTRSASSMSVDDTAWSSIIDLNQTYTYAPTYGELRNGYNHASIPTFLGEAGYEGYSFGVDRATPELLRRQEWWTMTSGATGQVYGGPSYPICNEFITTGAGSPCNTISGPHSGAIDSQGVAELEIETDLLNTLAWQNLVPDQTHSLVTSTTTCPTTGSQIGVTCVTDAETSDHTLGIAYDPRGAPITVDLTKMAGSTTARWYDPTSGFFRSITGSPFANTGRHVFVTPGDNNDGNPDWVLVLKG